MASCAVDDTMAAPWSAMPAAARRDASLPRVSACQPKAASPTTLRSRSLAAPEVCAKTRRSWAGGSPRSQLSTEASRAAACGEQMTFKAPPVLPAQTGGHCGVPPACTCQASRFDAAARMTGDLVSTQCWSSSTRAAPLEWRGTPTLLGDRRTNTPSANTQAVEAPAAQSAWSWGSSQRTPRCASPARQGPCVRGQAGGRAPGTALRPVPTSPEARTRRCDAPVRPDLPRDGAVSFRRGSRRRSS